MCVCVCVCVFVGGRGLNPSTKYDSGFFFLFILLWFSLTKKVLKTTLVSLLLISANITP